VERIRSSFLRAYYANFQGSLSCRNLIPADPAFFWVAISPLGHTQKEGKRAETSSKDFWGKCPPNSPDFEVKKP